MYIRIVIIMVTLVVGSQLGADPITMIGWGAVAWLFMGRVVDAGDTLAVSVGG